MKPQYIDGAQSDPFDVLRLENQLCFALYAATRAVARLYRERLTPLGLTYPQYLVLIVLWDSDGLTVSEIGKRLMLDSATLTPLIKRLENNGLVTRKRSTQDEREVEVWMQPEGQQLKEAVCEARRHVACRLGMSETEIMNLRGDMMALIRRAGETPG